MGITVSSYNFLKYITRGNKILGKTLTLGRQNDHYGWINTETGTIDKYCEPMLIKEFNASKVDSVDVSDYENATYLQDLNKPWTCKELVKQKYQSILDLGTIEHVFNVTQALDSIANACEIDGQIIHVQNHSDFCGHGFWQFSAELFFSWYSEKNGFKDLEIFIAPNKNPNLWFRCLKPHEGDRCDLSGRKVPQSEILVKVTKFKDVPIRSCQQSDYLHAWSKEVDLNISNKSAIRKTIICRFKKLIPKKLKIIIKAKYQYYKHQDWFRSNYLKKENLKNLLK